MRSKLESTDVWSVPICRKCVQPGKQQIAVLSKSISSCFFTLVFKLRYFLLNIDDTKYYRYVLVTVAKPNG